MRIIILLIVMLGLSGCFFAPGMRMPVTPLSNCTATQQIRPVFIPINTALICCMNRERYNQYNTYYVGAYDVLHVHVWGHPEFSAPLAAAPSENGVNATLNPTLAPVGYLVSARGAIFFPYLGYVDVEGQTIEEIRHHIMVALRKYVRNPQVDVRVSAFRSKKVYIMGEVKKPGIQPITDVPMSITDAINLAGGLMPDSADPSNIFIIRGCFSRPTVYWLDARSPAALLLAEQFYLQPHDVVYVNSANMALWNRAIAQVLPTIQSAWFTYSLVRTRC